MVELASQQEAIYHRALEFYKQGAWDQVIKLLVDVDEKTDDMRSLLAAARWQLALARAQRRSQDSRKETQETQAKPRRRLASWGTRALVVANLLVMALIALIVWQRGLPPALSALAQTSRDQPLLDQAEAAIEAQDWDGAIRNLEAFLEEHPENTKAQDLLSFAKEHRRLESLYVQGQGYYQRQRWDQALASFQGLRVSAPSFRADQVESYICQTYIRTIRTQIIEAGDAMGKLLPLQTEFRKYATECGGNEKFAAEQRLLDLYVAGLEAAQLGHWAKAVNFFNDVRESDPDYAGGQIARQLYATHVSRGQDLAGQGQWAQALDEYNTALALGVPDVRGANDLRMEAVATLGAPTSTLTPSTTPVPPTPTPTVTPTSTHTPSPTPTTFVRPVQVFRPTATPSPRPTDTPRPAPPKPMPPPPTATPIPPTNTPAPTNTPLPTPTPTIYEEVRPPTPTPKR